MFQQHKIVCENKEIIIYLFLYELDLDLATMKNIFYQLSATSLEKHVFDYFDQNCIKFLGQHIKIVYHSTIIKDFFIHRRQLQNTNIYATNVVNFYR